MKNYIVGRVSFVTYILVLCLVIVLVFTFLYIQKPHQEEDNNVFLRMFPSRFFVYESDSVNISIHFETGRGIPIKANVTWKLITYGETGNISSPLHTDSFGNLNATYYAPKDVDVINKTVILMAEAIWKENIVTTNCEGSIHPVLHETVITVSSEKKKMIAGETTQLKAKATGFVNEKWIPVANKPVHWVLYGKEEGTSGYRVLQNKKENTNHQGISEIFFFLSDVPAEMTVMAVAQFEMNLSDEIDYMECSNSFSLTITPEKPGDFPIVLIHGWSGSITNQLLNLTWWNLTQKLVKQGHKILDFDTSKPGIQYLMYEPSWEERHIPWIAAKVSKKIRSALVLNGYSPAQTIDIVSHSMGGLIARFMAEHGDADVDFWNKIWKPGDDGYPWYGDGMEDVCITGKQIDDVFLIGTPCRGVPPGIDERTISIMNRLSFPWWSGQIPDMIYHSKFLEAMGYEGCDIVDYYAIGGDIGFIVDDNPVDFDGDGIAHKSDGLVPAESPYLQDKPFLIIQGKAWPKGDADHISLIAANDEVHTYILEHLT